MCIGYDKLKPYGFPVHGAIDGYSRKILWLELSRSNNKPQMPAKYYLDGVKRNMGCPILLRTDCGTENGVMAAMQCYLRQGIRLMKWSNTSNMRILMNQISTKSTFIMC